MKPILAFMAALVLSVPAFAQVQGWIGVVVAEQQDRGVLVRSVEANSPAEKAGLKASDVILQYNKQDVVGVLHLQRLVNETPVGRAVDITVRRDNRDQAFKVISEKAPLAFGQLHIQGPNFVTLHDRITTSVQPFEVITSASASQAGIQTDSLTPQLRDFFGVKGGEGVLVASVDATSAAAKAGVMAGDVVTAVDGTPISRPQDFTREVRGKTGVFTLKVVRNKQEREIKVER